MLFDGTVRDNIALNAPDATDEEVIHAARVACAHAFVMDLPQGYGSNVGERGAALSGGQRQRIAIARAILSRPRMLILDEATSALDYLTERTVCENLRRELSGDTVFFITHRLATIRSADSIMLMENGLLQEIGTHQQLLARKVSIMPLPTTDTSSIKTQNEKLIRRFSVLRRFVLSLSTRRKVFVLWFARAKPALRRNSVRTIAAGDGRFVLGFFRSC